MSIAKFWNDESGVVTVDYVVLLGGATMMAVGALVALQTGLFGMGTTTAQGVGNHGAYHTAGNGPYTMLVEMDFEDGTAPGWSDPRFGNSDGFGNYLGRFGSETRTTPLTYSTNLSPGATAARIGFDLLIIHSWDGLPGMSNAGPRGDSMRLLEGGSEIGQEFFIGSGQSTRNQFPGYLDDRSGEIEINGVAYQYTMTQTSHVMPQHDGVWRAQRWEVVIDVTNPGGSLELGFIGDLSQAVHDESFAIDNFWVAERR